MAKTSLHAHTAVARLPVVIARLSFTAEKCNAPCKNLLTRGPDSCIQLQVLVPSCWLVWWDQ